MRLTQLFGFHRELPLSAEPCTGRATNTSRSEKQARDAEESRPKTANAETARQIYAHFQGMSNEFLRNAAQNCEIAGWNWTGVDDVDRDRSSVRAPHAAAGSKC